MTYRKENLKGDTRGRPPTLQDPVRRHIIMERSDYEDLRRAAEERGISISQFIRGIIVRALEKLRR